MRQLLTDAVEDFSLLRRSQGLKKGTLRNEQTVLKRLLAVSGNVWVHQMTDMHVTRYFERASKTRSPSALQIDHSTLVQFFDWARKTKRLPLDEDPMAFRKAPRRPHRERNRLHVTQFPSLLDTAGARHPRDRAAVALLLYLLLRDQEAADIRIGDLNLVDGRVLVRITKSRTEDWMPMSSELDTEMRAWLTYYAASVKRPLLHSDYLLPALHSRGIHREDEGGRITGHDLECVPDQPMGRLGRIVKPILIDMGFPVTDHAGRSTFEGAHTIRRSAARALFDRLSESGYDKSLRHVKEMMHHSSSEMTERYIGVMEDRRSRDEVILGRPMFPVATDNVLSLPVASGYGGTSDAGL